MNLQDHEYKHLVSKAELTLRDYPHIDPFDIVNDVLLEWYESGCTLQYHELVSRVVSSSKVASLNKEQSLNRIKFSRSEKERVCSTCKESIPINGFYLVRRKQKQSNVNVTENTTEEILYDCKKCHYINTYAIFKEKLKKYGTPESQKRANKKRKEKIKNDPKLLEIERQKRREYMKKYYSDPERKRKHLAIANRNKKLSPKT